MRVGVDISVPDPGHNWDAITISVDYWTQNQYSYGDPQTLTKTNAITGTVNYTNNGGAGTQTKRNTDTFTYNYQAGDYGGGNATTRTVGAKVSGTYNGVTPSVSVDVNIPNRPFGTPQAPDAPNASRNSDTNTDLSWTRHSTTGEPYSGQVLQRCNWNNGLNDWTAWATIATLGAAANSYTDRSTIANRSYRWRIKAQGSGVADDSGWSGASNTIYNTPDPPDGASLGTASGLNQPMSWNNNCGYPEFFTEVWRQVNGTWDSSPLAGPLGPASTYTDTNALATNKLAYRFRHVNSIGVRKYSDYSAPTATTAGATSAPSAPTNLLPSGTVDGSIAQTLSWTHNPTDGSAQRQYQLQHRKVGTSTWTVVGPTVSGTSKYVLAASTYPVGTSVEWQVQTWGAGPTASPMSALATFATSNPSTQTKYPMTLNPSTGMLEAFSSAALVIVLGPSDPVPASTPPGTVIMRTT